MILFPLAAALLGAILGSFINAFSYRFGTGRSIVTGRSRCMRCGHVLGVIDLVPVLSYVALRGKCRYCGTRISAQYPLVELVAGALGILVYVAHPEPHLFAYWLFVWMLLLFIVVYDLRHQIIPLSASFLFGVLALSSLFLEGTADTFAFMAGPYLALPLALLCLISAGRWMGWGDPLLQLGLGWIAGFWAGLSGLFIAFVSGAIVGILLIALGKRFTPLENGYLQKLANYFGLSLTGFTIQSEIPFAPFLVLGAAAAHFYHVDFFSHIAILW